MQKPELIAEIFRQLAFVSALVGGFAFAFVGVLLVAPLQSRIVSWTAGISMAASAGLVVCALGWSLGASVVPVGASMEAGAERSSLSASLNIMHLRLSLAFVVSILLAGGYVPAIWASSRPVSRCSRLSHQYSSCLLL